MHFVQTRLDDQRGTIWILPNVNMSGVHIDLNDPIITPIHPKWNNTEKDDLIGNDEAVLTSLTAKHTPYADVLRTAWQQPLKIGSTIALNES